MLQTIKLDHQPNLVLSCNKLSNHTLLRSHLSYLQKLSRPFKVLPEAIIVKLEKKDDTIANLNPPATIYTNYNATLAQIIQDFANPESLSRFLTTETYDKVVDSLM
ncbi:hypothetical protein HID58_002532 [Brassica napus]|uniref:Uncharacterized protein n=1 Tax=Brassica napus TaxID=3708 RepID=A0ABQ8EQK1_BRANA|nr:hypothetical protein HID58_002532 [Brassica napus]